ncbi:MAG: ABC transporter substrate-binding protein [Corynebacterium sp.]|nr:ABC transporter substrate-binding protein [Corynebacterium sp.]
MKTPKVARAIAASFLALATATGLAGCVTNEEDGHPATWHELSVEQVPALAELVPAEISSTGSITIGTNPPFAPAEFKDSRGEIIGFEIDLIKATAAVLGLDVNVQQQDFTLILPAVSAGTVDVGVSGFTDTEERQVNYDFVDILSAGIQWAQRPGEDIDPTNPCGIKLAVQRGTVSDDDAAVLNETCIEEGKPEIDILRYDTSDAAATALVLGRAQAFSADSPITAWAVNRAGGQIELVGDIYDAADYGWPVKKGSALGPALAAALEYLVQNGQYKEILDMWGIEDGPLDAITINGKAQSTNPAIAAN